MANGDLHSFVGGEQPARASCERAVVSGPAGPAGTNNHPLLLPATFRTHRDTASHRYREIFRRSTGSLWRKPGWEIGKNRQLRSQPDVTDGFLSGARLHPA